MTPSSMTSLITKLTEVFTALMGQIPEVSTTIIATDLLLLGIGIFFAGAIVAFFVRLLRST